MVEATKPAQTDISGTVTLSLPLDVVAAAITKLDLESKQHLFEMLYEQIEQADEDLLRQDPQVVAEIEEALREFEAGEYITWEAYLRESEQEEK